LDSSAIDISSRTASSATLALKSGEWFFRFVIWDHFFHKSILLNYWSETLRPPLSTSHNSSANVFFARDMNAQRLRKLREKIG
jgi:hypothetical protein